MVKKQVHVEHELFKVDVTCNGKLDDIAKYLCTDLGYSNVTAHNIISMIYGVLKRMEEE